MTNRVVTWTNAIEGPFDEVSLSEWECAEIFQALWQRLRKKERELGRMSDGEHEAWKNMIRKVATLEAEFKMRRELPGPRRTGSGFKVA